MAKLVLLRSNPESGFAIGRSDALSGTECVEVEDPSVLYGWLRQETIEADAVVLDRGLTDSLQVAQRIHSLDGSVAIIVLCDPERLDVLGQAVRMSPFLGEETRCCALGAGDELGRAIVAEMGRARHRRRGGTRRGRAPYAEQLLTIIDGTADAIFLKDLGDRYILVNAACARAFGGTPDQFAGVRLADVIPGEKLRELQEEDRRVVESGVSMTFEHSLEVAGVRRVYLTTKAPWRDADGRIVGVIGIAHDITERKRREETHYQEAQQAVRARDEFISIASHELKTPVAAFQFEMQAILREVRKDERCADHDRILDLAARAERQGARLVSLVNDLLDVSRIQAGMLRLQLRDVDLVAVTRAVVERLTDEERKLIGVEVAGSGPASGRWDATRIEQAVTNLLTNAIKYGGGRPVLVRIELGGDAVRLVVEDQGIGMSADFLKRIFRPFERETSSAKGHPGLGLGLYITRQVVEAHGGTIAVLSTPGSGSSFTVELPWAPTP